MSTKIRLKRFGTKRRPFYRIVVMDSRKPRDGRAIEEIGLYHPLEADETRQVRFHEDKVRDWISKGAQPTATVRRLLNNNTFTIT